MRRTVRKVFWLWQAEQEENWLNEMAAKGLCLVGVGWCRYDFEECVPGEYQIRLELLKNKICHAESEKYIQFVEETGAEQIGNYMRWVYFRKKTAEGPFELYSDNESRIKQLRLVLSLIALIGGLNLLVGFYNVLVALLLSSGFNYMGIINLVLGIFCANGFYKIYRRMKKLKTEQAVFE